MIELIIIYFLFPAAVISSAVLSWYIKKLLMIIEENSVEMKERFSAFHNFLDETYKMDLFYGEPRLNELLEVIKDFDKWASDFEGRVITEEEDDRTAED